MESKYKQPIGNVPAAILSLAFRLAGAFTSKINDVPSRKMVDGLLTTAMNTVKALSDADPNDEAQVKAIVNKMLSEGSFYEGSREGLLKNIQKIKHPKVQTSLALAVNPVYAIAGALTDELPDNGEQVKDLAAGFLATAEGVEFITSLVGIILDDETAAIVAIILIEALEAVLEDDGILAQLRTMKAEKSKLIGNS